MTDSDNNSVPSFETAPIAAVIGALGQRIERYRLSRNIRQADLAWQAGVSRVTLGKLERGEGGTLQTLARVLRALDIEERLPDLVPDATLSPLDPRSATGRPRQRVRQPAPVPDAPWAWGDADSKER